jgi:hypothetical protein
MKRRDIPKQLLAPAGPQRKLTAEDTLLARHFGEAFAAYRARVPSVLPGWRAG